MKLHVRLLAFSCLLFGISVLFISYIGFIPDLTGKRENFTIILKNIMDDEEKLLNSNGKQIFFVETALTEHEKMKKGKDACGVESAAKLNPDYDVYLLYATYHPIVKLAPSPMLDALAMYPNLHIRYLNLIEFAAGTPLEKFMAERHLEKSIFQVEHTSDVLRALSLYKYGGVYLDTDVITLAPVGKVGSTNFVCPETTQRLNTPIIGFDLNEGRKFTGDFLNRLNTQPFKYDDYTANGPNLFDKVVTSFCGNDSYVITEDRYCGGLKFVQRDHCFPLIWHESITLYDEGRTEEVFAKLSSYNAFFIHLWNRAMVDNYAKRFLNVSRDRDCGFMKLARMICPAVVSATDVF